MNDLYKEIAETVNEMIPEQWERFHFYAQVSDNGGGVYYFYNTPESLHHFQYSLTIPIDFELDPRQYKVNKRKLFALSDELRNVFIRHDQEPWYSFTMSLDREGLFNIHFDYTDWFNTEYSFSDQMVMWKYKYLGEEPVNGEDKGIIEKYSKEFPENPI